MAILLKITTRPRHMKTLKSKSNPLYMTGKFEHINALDKRLLNHERN